MSANLPDGTTLNDLPGWSAKDVAWDDAWERAYEELLEETGEEPDESAVEQRARDILEDM